MNRRTPQEHTEQDILELVLGEPAHGGACVARDAQGRVVFVRLGLPGERVHARITKRQNRLAWADVVEVIEPSPDRVASPFPVGDVVGGSEMSHVRPSAARRWKQRVLRGQLRRVGGESLAARVQVLYGAEGPEVQPTGGDADPADPLLGRRTRARFVVGDSGRLGMRRFRSHQVIELDDYPFLDPRFSAAGVFTDDKWRHLWRPGDGVTLVAASASDPLVVVGDRAWNLRGEEVPAVCAWEVALGDVAARYETFATSFWQVHRDAPATLAAGVIRAAGDLVGKSVMELYSGSGLFSYFLAGEVGPEGRIVTLEQSEQAVAQAEQSLRPVNDGQVQFFEGDVDAASVAELTAELSNAVDVIIMDPPRTGVGRAAVEAACRTGAARIVLVSCDPAAGARDLADFERGGYRLDALAAWDLFPHTHHFEMVSTLTRADLPAAS